MGAYEPFEYDITKDESVRIFRAGRLVTSVRGRAAAALIRRLGKSEEADQAALQRVTGNYRRGNERR